jgi:hypothetical protein
VDRDQRMTGGQQAGLVGERSTAEVLAQGDHGEQADDWCVMTEVLVT